MPRTEFWLSKAGHCNRLLEFSDPPTWEALASRLGNLYAIPLDKVGVSYVHKENTFALNSNEELQNFYRKSHDPTAAIMFDVLDLSWPSRDADQPPLKRPRLGSNVSERGRARAEDWLLELHAKIWNRKDRQQELFRTAQLTIADYEKLQQRIAELHPDRQEEEYRASHEEGVLSAKLDVLRSSNIIPGTGLGHPADPADVDDEQTGNDNDVDDGLRSLFPFTVEYLDLSSLELQVLPPRMTLPLLIREEYSVLSKFLDGLSKDSRGSAIISGQPGIGKTTYLYLQLIRCMIAGTPCLLQTGKNTVYLVAESVTIVDAWSGGHIVAFCDADEESSEPPKFILENRWIQIIAVSSPKGAYEKWVEKPLPNSTVRTVVSKLWSRQELFLTGIFLNNQDLLYSRLQESTTYFCYNPRNCFNASISRRSMFEGRGKIEEKIHEISDYGFNTFLGETRTKRSPSHTIFQLSPRDDLRLLRQAELTAVSQYALDALLDAKEEKELGASLQFYKTISSSPEAGTLQGQIFERQVLRYFGNLKEPKQFVIRSLTDSTSYQWWYPGPTKCSPFRSSPVIQSLQDAVTHKKPLHLVPEEPNFFTVDSVLYNGEVLDGIKIIVRKEHPVAVSGLKRIQSWLKQGTPLGNLRPSISGKHWRLIFVVPEDMAKSFFKQPFEDDTNMQGWSKKVDQYVLGIKEDTVWTK